IRITSADNSEGSRTSEKQHCLCLFVVCPQDSQEKNANPVKAEEAKLKAKYPGLGQKPGGSDFLMKRLQKGVSDRSFCNASLSLKKKKCLNLKNIQKYFDSGDYNMAKAKMKNKQLPVAGPDKNLVTGDHIPTPQDLPQRKSSLVTSKLAG
uniref:Alpha-endosulfine n=1 Tax=Stegastes partitus TaxID=144197 RepID=A0A3B5A786_9TELE